MNRIREEAAQALDLFWMLWWHGTFPLRWVTYSAGAAYLIGALTGMSING
jgi:hypothetical protein